MKTLTTEELKLQALATFLECDIEELNTSSYNDCLIEYGNEEYLVCTDSEADDLWEEDLDNYLEECVYPGLPDNLKNYFDDEKWKNDARFDGRGHSLNRYDGNEEEVQINGETFYIYRQN